MHPYVANSKLINNVQLWQVVIRHNVSTKLKINVIVPSKGKIQNEGIKRNAVMRFIEGLATDVFSCSAVSVNNN